MERELCVERKAQETYEIGVENGKHSGPSDYSKQILASAKSNPLGISITKQRTQ